MELPARDRLHAPRADGVQADLSAARRPRDPSQPGKEAGIVVDFVHPATPHDDPVVTLHSLLDRDVYRGGAIVVGPVRRGRGRRLRVERRVLPVSADPERRAQVFERELWRIAVENLSWSEQHVWAAFAGARVASNNWRRAKAMLHFDTTGELRRRFVITCLQRNRNTQLRVRALHEVSALRTPRRSTKRSRSSAVGRATSAARASRCCSRLSPSARSAAATRRPPGSGDLAEYTREVHEEYASQRWPETKRLLGLLVNSSGRAHARNARRLVQATRNQDRRLSAALLAAALAHTPEAEEVLRGARTRMARKPSALARELLRNFPKGKRRRGGKRRRCRSRRGGGQAAERRRQTAAAEGGGRPEGREKAQAGGSSRAAAKKRNARKHPERAKESERQAANEGPRAGSPALALEMHFAGVELDEPLVGRDDERAGPRYPARLALAALPSDSAAEQRVAHAPGGDDLGVRGACTQRRALPKSASRSADTVTHRGSRRPLCGDHERGRGLAQLVGELLRCRRDVQPDPEHRPARLRAPFDKDPRELAAASPRLVGPLDLALDRRDRLACLADRDRSAERQQAGSLTQSRRTIDIKQRLARRGGPGAPLTAAARTLLRRGDERAVGCPRDRELSCPLVGRAGQAVMDMRAADHRGRNRTSTSGASRIANDASPRLIAIASER